MEIHSMKKLYGTGVALVTPFKDNGNIDFNGLEKLVKHVINNNVNYIVVLGTTAETSTLIPEEKKEIIECIKSSNSLNLPLVLGIGGNDTKKVIKQINKTKNISDFYAILSVSPYYNKPTQEGIYQHFSSIIQNTNVRIIIYNVPKRTGSNINPDTVLRLSNRFKNKILGIKEASGDLLQSYRIVKQKSPNFILISGDDYISIPTILGGGNGVISVIAQALPNQVSNMISLAMKNEIKKSFNIFYKIIDIIDLIYREGNPTGIKTLLNIMGICSPYVRLPLLMGTNILKENIKKCFKELNFS